MRYLAYFIDRNAAINSYFMRDRRQITDNGLCADCSAFSYKRPELSRYRKRLSNYEMKLQRASTNMLLFPALIRLDRFNINIFIEVFPVEITTIK